MTHYLSGLSDGLQEVSSIKQWRVHLNVNLNTLFESYIFLWVEFSAAPSFFWFSQRFFKFFQTIQISIFDFFRKGTPAQIFFDYLPFDISFSTGLLPIPVLRFENFRLNFGSFDDDAGSFWLHFTSEEDDTLLCVYTNTCSRFWGLVSGRRIFPYFALTWFSPFLTLGVFGLCFRT